MTGGSRMRAFRVRLPSGAGYWTVLDEDLAVVAVADGFLRQVRLGRDGAESTTKSYANSIALFLRWCARTGRTWQAGVEQLVLLMARAGLRRGEVLGLRRSDVHLLVDSRALGCAVTRAHVHVVRRDDNANGAVAKSRRARVVPLDFVTVQAFDTYEFERRRVLGVGGS